MGTADKDYFLDADKQVTDDEEKAAFVLIRKGQDIPKEMADVYGIGKVAQQEDKTAEQPVKAAHPSGTKAKTPKENKGVK